MVCAAIKTVVEPLVEPTKLKDVFLGVEEMVKDVETHGRKTDPRLIMVSKKMGGISIDTFDIPKARSKHNGFGGMILKELFGDDYSTSIEGDAFKGHLFIRSGMQPQPKQIKHAA